MSTILILAAVGALALIAELVLPGGVLGVVGGICLLAAAVMSFVEYGLVVGLLVSLAFGLFSLGLLWGWMRHFHRLPFTRDLILHRGNARGDSSSTAVALDGQRGTALTELNPSGRVRCGDERIDAIAESEAIPQGAHVVVVRRSGPGWVVQQAEAPQPDQTRERR